MQVVAGRSHSCGVNLPEGSLWCWGNNSNGALTATEFSATYRMTGVPTVCSDPTGTAGTMIYNADLNVMQYCDGVGWVKVGK